MCNSSCLCIAKKYNINAVRIICNGKRIPFIERDPAIFSLDALSIFKL